MEKRYTTRGFAFLTEADAALAAQEAKKIQYLEKRLVSSTSEQKRVIYEKAIQDSIFKTPVGLTYLGQLQKELMEEGAEELPPIPLPWVCVAQWNRPPQPARDRVRTPQTKEEKKPGISLFFSLALNGLLAVAVVAMFVIALKSDQPNILNYKTAITNQYASWEQELAQREEAVRAKERQLGLESGQ